MWEYNDILDVISLYIKAIIWSKYAFLLLQTYLGNSVSGKVLIIVNLKCHHHEYPSEGRQLLSSTKRYARYLRQKFFRTVSNSALTDRKSSFNSPQILLHCNPVHSDIGC